MDEKSMNDESTFNEAVSKFNKTKGVNDPNMDQLTKSDEQKLLELILQQRNLIINQTNDIRRIKANVIFLFWTVIIPPVLVGIYFLMNFQRY
jgi:hypothetical protein